MIAAAIKNMIGGTEKDPIVVMNAALASSGVLISPLMTFDIEFYMSLSTVVSMGFTIAGIAINPMSVGKK